jgi:DNA polymerase III delta prime subunit
LNLGIISFHSEHYKKEYDHVYHRIKIYGEEIDKYLSIVGSLKYKITKNIKRNTNKDVIPGLLSFFKEKVKNIRKELKVTESGQFLFGDKRNLRFKIGHILDSREKREITYPVLNRFFQDLSLMPSITSIEDLKKVCQRFLESNYYYSRISRKEYINREKPIKVYDFSVPSSHSFFSNGYISHNTTFARLCAKQLGINEQNIHEFNMADNTGVDNARDIAQACQYMPFMKSGETPKKAYILDEFHRATAQAQDCLLKPFEEPPDYVYFFVCTTDPQKVVKTIRSRAQKFEVAPLEMEEMVELLEWVCEEERKDVDPQIIRKIAMTALGTPRDALVMLSTVIDTEDVQTALAMISDGVGEADSIEICRVLADSKMGAGEKWDKLKLLINNLKNPEWERLRLAVAGYMASIVLKSKVNAFTDYCQEIGDLFALANFQYSGRAGFVFTTYLASRVKIGN